MSKLIPLINDDSYECYCKELDNYYFFYTYDTQGVFTFLSPGVTEVLGYAQEGFLKHFSTYLTDHPINLKVEAHTQQALLGIKQSSYTVEIYRVNRTTCWLEITESPIFDDSGCVTGVEGVARDITDLKEVEKALKRVQEENKQQEQLQAALDAADAGTFSYDVINEKTYWDEKSCNIFGVDSETFLNNYLTWKELVFSEDLAETELKLKSILNSEQTRFELEYRINVDNCCRWVNVKAQITRNEQGEAIWIDGLHLNTTKTKTLENKLLESEDRFRNLVENSPDWIWETNSEGRYTYSSPHVKDLLGYYPEELTGMTLFSLIPGDERLHILDKVQKCFRRHTGFVDVEHINVHKNGTRVVLETTATPVFNQDREFMGYRGIHRDITQRRKNKKLELEKEIAELANQAKSEFLANMSHELRTPMHAILSFSNFGIKKFNTAPSEKILSYFEKIHQSGERLLSLLNALLDLSKLEAGKLEFNYQFHDLELIVKRCIDEQEAYLNSKKINTQIISLADDRRVQCDMAKILQVITNFVSNAIKFSEPSTTIIFEIKAEELFSDTGISQGLKLSVTDQGIGIPEDELEQVFDKFVQSSHTKSNAGGTGLGLSICKEFIDAHHGRIWAERNPQGGSIFNFVIPLKQPEIY